MPAIGGGVEALSALAIIGRTGVGGVGRACRTDLAGSEGGSSGSLGSWSSSGSLGSRGSSVSLGLGSSKASGGSFGHDADWSFQTVGPASEKWTRLRFFLSWPWLSSVSLGRRESSDLWSFRGSSSSLGLGYSSVSLGPLCSWGSSSSLGLGYSSVWLGSLVP